MNQFSHSRILTFSRGDVAADAMTTTRAEARPAEESSESVESSEPTTSFALSLSLSLCGRQWTDENLPVMAVSSR